MATEIPDTCYKVHIIESQAFMNWYDLLPLTPLFVMILWLFYSTCWFILQYIEGNSYE